MLDLYLYVSKQKVAQLSEQSPNKFQGITSKLEFKFPFISAGVSGQPQTSTISDLIRLIPVIEMQFEISNSDSISLLTPPPVFFKFSGPGARQVEADQFWLAMESENTAILLAGSASNALGSYNTVGANISPSADPIKAVHSLIERQFNNEAKDTNPSFDLSYLWRCLMAPTESRSLILPQVEGIAIFCGILQLLQIR